LVGACRYYGAGGVLREIRAYGRHLRDSSTVDESEVYEQQKHIAVTLILVVVMFIVCWTPLVVYAIYSTLVRDEERIHHLANPVVSVRATAPDVSDFLRFYRRLRK